MILKMVLYLENTYEALNLRFLRNWSREALFLRNFLDQYIILVPIEQSKECLRFKFVFRFLRDEILSSAASRGTGALVSSLKIKDFHQKFFISDNVFMSIKT